MIKRTTARIVVAVEISIDVEDGTPTRLFIERYEVREASWPIWQFHLTPAITMKGFLDRLAALVGFEKGPKRKGMKPEVSIPLGVAGVTLRYVSADAGTPHVRLCDAAGQEIALWKDHEWSRPEVLVEIVEKVKEAAA